MVGHRLKLGLLVGDGARVPFKGKTWEAFAKGHCGLVQVSTGAGKTYAAYGAALADWLDQPESHGLHTLYLTPLRAMTRDLEKALCEISADLAPALVVEARTGGTRLRPSAHASESVCRMSSSRHRSRSLSFFLTPIPGNASGGCGRSSSTSGTISSPPNGARRPSWPLPVCARGARVCARGP